jgi:hypothetical protein
MVRRNWSGLGACGGPQGETFVCHRWCQSFTGGDQQSFRPTASGAALPQSQDSQRVRPLAGRTEAQVKAAMRASYKLEAKEGMARLRKLSDWLEQESPAAANDLREGLEECFTINRLGIPPSLHRCLATTNLIESPPSGVRLRTRRVCRWRDAAMVQRWAAASFLATEKNCPRIMAWKDLWQLETLCLSPPYLQVPRKGTCQQRLHTRADVQHWRRLF